MAVLVCLVACEFMRAYVCKENGLVYLFLLQREQDTLFIQCKLYQPCNTLINCYCRAIVLISNLVCEKVEPSVYVLFLSIKIVPNFFQARTLIKCNLIKAGFSDLTPILPWGLSAPRYIQLILYSIHRNRSILFLSPLYHHVRQLAFISFMLLEIEKTDETENTRKQDAGRS